MNGTAHDNPSATSSHEATSGSCVPAETHVVVAYKVTGGRITFVRMFT